METTWENIPQDILEDLDISISDSTTKNYQNVKKRNIAKFLIEMGNRILTIIAALGWLIAIPFLLDLWLNYGRGFVDFIWWVSGSH